VQAQCKTSYGSVWQMSEKIDCTAKVDSGLFALILLMRFHGNGTPVESVRDLCGTDQIGIPEMLRSARQLGFNASWREVEWYQLASMPLPFIAPLLEGEFLSVVRVAEDELFVIRPGSRPANIRRAEFEEVWDKQLVIITRGADLTGFSGRWSKRLSNFVERLCRWFEHQAHAAPIDPGKSHAITDTTKAGDDGLAALIMLLRFHGIGAESEQIRHQCGAAKIGVAEMLRCAKELGLKARARATNWERLGRLPLPVIAPLRDGRYLLVAKVAEDKILVQYPSSTRPEAMTRAHWATIWDGRVVLMARRANLSDLTRRFDIAWFVGAVHKYRHLLAEVLVMSFFLQLFALVSPLFFQVVIDKVLVHRSLSTLDVLMIGLVTIALFEGILGTLRTYLFAHTANRIDVELGARLYRHLLALPIAYFQARRVGDSVARVRELENIRQFLTSSALTLVIDLFFTVVFLVVMFYYSSLLTFAVITTFPLYIGVSAGATPLFRRRLDEKFLRGSENQAFLVETVTGVETLKAMAVEPQMQRRWEEQLAGYVAASFRVTSLGNAASQAVQVINKVVTAAVLYLGAKLVIDGSLSVGELVAFNMLAARISAPVLRLAQMWQDFHQARLSVDRLGDILNTMPEPRFNPMRAALPAIQGRVTLEHVTFRYRVDSSEVLHDVSFDVSAGQLVGIVGSSGSGKSTIAKLLQRLYVPESGRVLVDGVDLSMVDLAWLRRQVGVVLQENVLFNCSVRDNIALSDPTVGMTRIMSAAKLAGANEFILELSEGYDTIIGERGNSLSGGQRQRIAIARAIIGNPRILIFDEATSALDYESERIIQQNMKQIAAGRTVFVIAHRLSTVRFADRIITIERGRLVEDGTHDELVQRNGRYAKLHYMQTGLHEVR
jgi:ATP-binding cassette, subfamily B, bacterial HlyB/CyaB